MGKSAKSSIKISSPGRICLFGEHQDYLMLPVIAAAISLRISIEGKPRNDSRMTLNLPDIQSHIDFTPGKMLEYELERDYFRSSVNVLQRNGYTFSKGYNCTVRSEIPIKAGTSSSSALIVAWIAFLALISDQRKLLSPNFLAQFAYEAEVLEFQEPGGMMDQITTAMGGVLHLDFFPSLFVNHFRTHLKSFILGDSREPKNTKEILSGVKDKIIDLTRQIQIKHKEFSLQTLSIDELDYYHSELSGVQENLLKATVQNRDITREASLLFHQSVFDGRRFGELLNEHHSILRSALKISTSKIDRMLNAALDAGAFGGKINGSGGGGCMFVYAPDQTEQVAEAIEREGGKAYIVHVDDGVRIESGE